MGSPVCIWRPAAPRHSGRAVAIMKTINLTLLLAACFMCPAGPPALAATIKEIERLPFDQAYRLWLQEEESLFQRSASPHSAIIITGGSTDAKTGKFTPTSFQALTCRLGRDAHTHEAFLLSALRTNEYVSMILDTSSRLCSQYGIESQATVLYDPKLGYTSVTRDFVLGPEAQRSIWLKAMTKPVSQPTSSAQLARALPGRSVGAAPQLRLGAGPICNSSVPPATIWSWVSQVRVNSLPFSVADWMYMFCGELSRATTVNLPPL